ncbi:hypothetical protein [Tropicimonas sp. S265A]|uniref:hypothetical protein n=1 Tax=Tropicimonas sp. S265A TaxID=3415134 RepID=UPI003C7976FC
MSQSNPVEAARAAGLYGVTPDLGRPLGNPRAEAGRQIAWDRFGIYFEEHDLTAFVAALDPNGAAAQQGAKVGDVLRGSDLMGARRDLQGILHAFEGAARRQEPPTLLLYVFDADSGWQREYQLTAAAPGAQAARIPPTLRGAVTSHKGLMAILQGDPSLSDPYDIAYDAMLALQAISMHVKNCSGPNAVDIPVTVTTTTTTRNGFGTIRGTETEQYTQEFRVRPEFAQWARSNINVYPPQPISTVRSAVLDLISVEGCAGSGFKQLEAGLAAVMGVSLPDTAGDTQQGGLPSDASAFVASCFPLQQQAMAARGLNAGERGLAQICFCQEHAARSIGDLDLYESLKILDNSVYNANPQMHGAFETHFNECYRAQDGSELRRRVEALWRDLNI